MIRELRNLDKTNHAKAVYIRNIQNRGVIQKIINEKGYVCYDTEEYKKHKANARWGRPPKVKNNKE